MSKRKIMTNIEDDQNEIVSSYIYLGHNIKPGLDNQTAEIRRRIRGGSAAIGKLWSIFKSNMNNSLKRKVFDMCVLTILTYGAETLTISNASANSTKVHGNCNAEVSLRDKIRNEWNR